MKVILQQEARSWERAGKMRLVKVVPDPLTPGGVAIAAAVEPTRGHWANLGGRCSGVKQIVHIAHHSSFAPTKLKDFLANNSD
jgi:hypothetical protein